MSQQDPAGALNVSRQAVPRWKAGVVIPNMDSLLALSKSFRIPTDEPMGGDRVVSVPGSEKMRGSGNRKGCSVLKVILIILAATAFAATVVITYLSQRDTEPEERNTVRLKGLEGERISDPDAAVSEPVS